MQALSDDGLLKLREKLIHQEKITRTERALVDQEIRIREKHRIEEKEDLPMVNG
jgi:hypothetical protein